MHRFLLLIGVLAARPLDGQVAQARALLGVVRDENRVPVPGVRLSLVGTPRVSFTNDSGIYRFGAIERGAYSLRVVRIGFAPVLDTVRVSDDGNTVRGIQLVTKIPALSQVTITPGAFTLLDPTAVSRLSLSREALLTAPQLAEDIFRSLNRLPGLSGSDFSAKIRIRNGGVDEQLYTLDGLELIEPFHLKDFDGALSILDGEAIGRVSVTTGGFTTVSGNRMAGVVAMESAVPSASRSRTAVGLSISNVRARSEGSFGGGRGSWLVSGRRGYLDVILKLIGTEDPPDPRYSDVFGKVQYRLARKHTATVHGLLGADHLRLSEDDGSNIVSRYGNRYLWTTVRSQFGERVSATTIASLASLTWDRDVKDFERFSGAPYERVRIRDRRTLGAVAIKQDWSVDVAPALSVQVGGELRGEDAEYSYARSQVARGAVGSTVVVLDSSRVDATTLATLGLCDGSRPPVAIADGRSWRSGRPPWMDTADDRESAHKRRLGVQTGNNGPRRVGAVPSGAHAAGSLSCRWRHGVRARGTRGASSARGRARVGRWLDRSRRGLSASADHAACAVCQH